MSPRVVGNIISGQRRGTEPPKWGITRFGGGDKNWLT